MGSRLGRRVVQFANLPIKLLMPNSFTNIHEIALKTIPSATKIEIKRVLQSLYGFDVDKVRTLNMEGKKKKRGGLLIAKPDYKKAYVTLKTPLSISPDLYPIRIIDEDKKRINKQAKSSLVQDHEAHTEAHHHWLHDRKEAQPPFRPQKHGRLGRPEGASNAKFPWSSMRSASGSTRAGIAPLLIWVTNFDLVKAFEFANVKFSYGLALLIPLLP
ncbi:hypothetical protein D0Y65_047230 [Glycine soja]|nr:hypothetical protein D0Y65_047230 [Glycine soja]